MLIKAKLSGGDLFQFLFYFDTILFNNFTNVINSDRSLVFRKWFTV